jgi:hypothetical protein
MISLEKKILFQMICITCLLISHFFLSYDFNGGWWHSSFFGYLVWGKQFFYVSGLQIPKNTVVRILLATFILTILSATIQTFIAGNNGVSIQPEAFTSYLHNVFYILNEEIILGSILLYLLVRRFKIKPIHASLGLAILVSLAHFILYKWYFRDKGYLDIITLLSLTLVVFVKNNLILRHRHIGYAWALHFSWMAVMYGSRHYHNDTLEPLTDLEKFNLYLGSFWVMVACLIMAGFDLINYRKDARNQARS